MSRGHFVSPTTDYPWPAFGRIGHHRLARTRQPARRPRRLVGDRRLMLLRRAMDLHPEGTCEEFGVRVVEPGGDRSWATWIDAPVIAAEIAIDHPGQPVRMIHQHGTVVELAARVVR